MLRLLLLVMYQKTLVKVDLFEFNTVFAVDVILAPRNVRIKRLSHTEMEISWDAPSAVGTAQITGYVVHYTAHVTPDEIDRWPSVNTGAVTSVRIGQLEPHTVYAAAVRARSADSRLGTFSDIAVDNHIGKLVPLSTCIFASFSSPINPLAEMLYFLPHHAMKMAGQYS